MNTLDEYKKNGKKHYKKTFDKISSEKRERIISASIEVFASKGFNAANINIISEKAGISIGSMYNYFSSKEKLFLSIADEAYSLLEESLKTIDLEQGDFFQKFEKLLKTAITLTKKYQKIMQIYLDITSEGLSHLSQKLSRKMESITAVYYRALINQAKEEGIIRNNVDEFTASFCLDNLVLLLQFSYTSDYFLERMKSFAGEDIVDNEERLIQGIMDFIKAALKA